MSVPTKLLAVTAVLLTCLVATGSALAHGPKGRNAWTLNSTIGLHYDAPDWSVGDHDARPLTTDQTDLNPHPKTHVVYMHPSDRASRFAQFAHVIQGQSRRASRLLTNLTGYGLRFDDRRDSSGREILDITVVKAKANEQKLGGSRQFAMVYDELTRLKLTHPDKKYLVWVDAPSDVCGRATLRSDNRRIAANGNEARSVATINRPSDPARTDGGWCVPILHELGHAMGAVLPQAPHEDGGGHCNDFGNDIMCVGASTVPFDPTAGRWFDHGNDDYWDPAADPRSESREKLPWWTVNLSRFLCPPVGTVDAPAADCSMPNQPAY